MAASTALSIRLPRTATRSWRIQADVVEFALGVIDSSTPRSAAWADLPSRRAASTGSRDGRHDPVGEFLGRAEFLGREGHRLFRAAQFDQADHRVEAVGRLVGGRSQRVGEAALGVELARHVLGVRCGRAGSRPCRGNGSRSGPPRR